MRGFMGSYSGGWFGWIVLASVVAACGADDGTPAQTTTPFVPTTTADPSTTTEPDPSGSTVDTQATNTDGPGDGTTVADGNTTAPGDDTTTTADPDLDGEPGEFTLTFEGRDYRLYVPSGYTHATAMPLLVGFHGAGDSGGNFYAFTQLVGMGDAAEPAEYILVVPDTKSPYSDFANWSGNPNNDIDQMVAEMDEILALTDDVGTHYNLDDQQLHAFGFSNGGLFTAITGMARADRLATLAVLGYGWGGSYLPPAAPSRSIPVQFGCGNSDSFYSYAQQSETYLAGQGHDTRLVTAAGVGHSFSGIMGVLAPSDLFGWMQARPLP